MEVNKGFRPWGMEEKQFITLMHLSQLAGYFVPLLGFILPIAMWASNKDQSEAIDLHGKKITNWLISLIIYGSISFLFVFILVGIIPLIILGVLSVLYPILGAVQANNGKLFDYPLTINFIR